MVIDAEFEEIEDATESSANELDLSEDDSLPWLESDEDDDTAGGVDTAQIIGFAAILLALLLGVVGAIYLISNRDTGSAVVADGSTIEAPEGPIKERPEDPGGKEFAGTGNVAPAVGEGETREGQVASGTQAARAAASGSESGTGAGATSGSSSDSSGNTASSSPGVGVQLAAYSSRARAEQGWGDLTRQTDALSGLRYRVVEGEVDGSTVYRLQAVAGDRAAADRLCSALKADGLDCAVKP